ncbi:hypothetical protein N8768_03980 [Flavobacteriaceae bacterium]|jgi:hypothetical protein|nr:hypothetical protein [Flavobacteriaceae bacterium]
MNRQEFSEILINPHSLRTDQIKKINLIVDKFPYFQSARAIYLKGLKSSNSFKYNQALKTTAAYTTNRNVLFDFITSDSFNQNDISQQIKESGANIQEIEVMEFEDISVNKSIIIDDALKQHLRDSEAVVDPELFRVKITTAKSATNSIITDKPSKSIELKAQEELDIGKPLNFNKNEVHSFSEWLKITSFKPIIRKGEIEEKEQPIISQKLLEKKLNLIDKFIESNPKITPIKQDQEFTDLTSKNLMKSDTLMTETLARIYLEQKQYTKAIKSYEILSLKYPEKSGFFADQIKAIQVILDKK